MTIHHIYFTAGCCLWIYILLCLAIKLTADVLRRKARERKIHRIVQFFSAGHLDRTRVHVFQKLLRDMQDDFLFDYTCDLYTVQCHFYAAEEKSILDLYMKQILQQKIQQLAPGDLLARCALINNIYQCRLTSDAIRLFLLECGEHTQLEQYCIDLQKASWLLKATR